MTAFDLTGKNILVTGASSGLGRQCAITASQHGANVYLTGRNLERLLETYNRLSGSGHHRIPADLTRAEDIANLVGQLPLLNGVVYSTGISDLSTLKNMIVYIFLIGSLLALIVGNNAFIRDRRSGVLRIVFSRPLSRQTYIFGKIIGILETLVLMVFVSFLISLFSIALVSGHLLPAAQVLKLLGFYP